MSFPPYDELIDSGINWLGEVPKHWKVVSIKWLSPVQRGASPRPIDDAKYFDDGGEFAWVRIADVSASNDGRLRETTQRLSELGSSLSVKIYPGEIFVSIAGTVGKPCISEIKACIHDGFVYFPHIEINRHFLFRIFEAGLCYGGLGKWGTQLNLNTDTVGSIRIPVPPEDELNAIVEFLDVETSKIDGLVSEQRRLIELLKEKRQAVISHAVTKGLNPNAPMKPSGIQWLGDVPQHWMIGKCGYYVSILSGYAFPSSGFSDDETNIRLLRGINVGVSEIRWEETVYWQRNDGDELDRFELSAGDLVIGMDRPWISSGVRVAKISENDLPCLLLQRVAAISTDARLHTDFLWHLLSSEMFVGYFAPETTGVSVPHISPSQIEDFEIPVPPIEEQEEIVEFVATETTRMDTLLAEAERAIELLQERRTALISAAVTGKIDVRGVIETAAP